MVLGKASRFNPLFLRVAIKGVRSGAPNDLQGEGTILEDSCAVGGVIATASAARKFLPEILKYHDHPVYLFFFLSLSLSPLIV